MKTRESRLEDVAELTRLDFSVGDHVETAIEEGCVHRPLLQAQQRRTRHSRPLNMRFAFWENLDLSRELRRTLNGV